MKKTPYLLLFMICVLFSCINTNHTSDSVTSSNEEPQTVPSEKDTETLPEYLFDTWGTPHAAFINIKLNPDGRFVFNDCDDNGDTVVREGTYEFKNGNVILHYQNGFSLSLICHEEFETYYLYTKDKSHYFVKGLIVPDPEETDSSYHDYLQTKKKTIQTNGNKL